MWKPKSNVWRHIQRCYPPPSQQGLSLTSPLSTRDIPASEHWGYKSSSLCLTFSLRFCSLNLVLMPARHLTHWVPLQPHLCYSLTVRWVDTWFSVSLLWKPAKLINLIHAWSQPQASPVLRHLHVQINQPCSQAPSCPNRPTLWLGYVPLSYPSKRS